METNISPLILTSLSPQDITALMYNTLEKYFSETKVLHPPTSILEDRIVGVDGAAEVTDLSTHRVYFLFRTGKMPGYKKGGKLYFSTKELTAWIKEGRRNTIDQVDRQVDAFLSDTKKRNSQRPEPVPVK